MSRTIIAFAVLLFASSLVAADNELTSREKEEGWMLLFDGQTFSGWTRSDGKPSNNPIEDHCINPHKCGAYMMIHEKPHENFVLSLDFKISKACNSGVFFHTFPLEPLPGKDVGYNGLEVAIDDTTTAGFHDTGAIYDLVKPKKNAMKPVGEWNHLELTCNKNLVSVKINGEQISEMNLDEWTKPFTRPDGSAHKFEFAFKEHPRKGYIGLQDHGANCWYKNIKLRELK